MYKSQLQKIKGMIDELDKWAQRVGRLEKECSTTAWPNERLRKMLDEADTEKSQIKMRLFDELSRVE